MPARFDMLSLTMEVSQNTFLKGSHCMIFYAATLDLGCKQTEARVRACVRQHYALFTRVSALAASDQTNRVLTILRSAE